ncbi:hypothetical protein A2U01_0081214, partial [Trifolium medium]|nr:hypothetical protein [Trifolium medium]
MAYRRRVSDCWPWCEDKKMNPGI